MADKAYKKCTFYKSVSQRQEVAHVSSVEKNGRGEADSNFFQLTASPINFEECIQFCDYYVRTLLQK